MARILFCILAISALGCATPSGTAVNLHQHQWRDRVVLLFSDDENHADLVAMRSALAQDLRGVRERDMVIYVLKPSSKVGRQFGVAAHGFTFILVGKDGGEKMRQAQVVALKELYATIDRMPMRQREMRRTTEQ
ncbi:MAG: DUF4174 domain-containing protein [bacterium]